MKPTDRSGLRRSEFMEAMRDGTITKKTWLGPILGVAKHSSFSDFTVKDIYYIMGVGASSFFSTMGMKTPLREMSCH